VLADLGAKAKEVGSSKRDKMTIRTMLVLNEDNNAFAFVYRVNLTLEIVGDRQALGFQYAAAAAVP
jgi:hypothetical protein